MDKSYSAINELTKADLVIAIYKEGEIRLIKNRFGTFPKNLYLDDLLELLSSLPQYKSFQPLIIELINKVKQFKVFV
jgi:hypothetical protein